MERIKNWLSFHFQNFNQFENSVSKHIQLLTGLLVLIFWLAITLSIIYCGFHSQTSFAATGASLPGEDASGKLEAAGILLKTLDTGLFKWGARIFAGICIMSSAWSLKEQRFGIAVICVIGAIIFGTAPKWVRNIFEIGDNQSIFSKVDYPSHHYSFATAESLELQKKLKVSSYV